MYVKKRMSLLLFAALAMVLFTACGRWNFSREAAKAANEAQGETLRVEFTVEQKFTNALRAALEENIQPADVEKAMRADESIKPFLTSGYRLDVYPLRADISAKDAAKQLAAEFVNRLAGCEDKGYISMVKADNGYFYEAVLTYKHSSSGSSSGNDSNDKEEIFDVTFHVGKGGTVTMAQGDANDTFHLTSNDTITFNAVPDEDWVVLGTPTTTNGKIVDNGDGSYTLSDVTGDAVVTVNFNTTHKVTFRWNNDEGRVVYKGKTSRDYSSVTINDGEGVRFEVVCNRGFKVESVTSSNGHNPVMGDNGVYSLNNITSDVEICVTFVPLTKHKISIHYDPDQCWVVSKGPTPRNIMGLTLYEGEQLIFEVTPEKGYSIASVTMTMNSTDYEVKINEDNYYQAAPLIADAEIHIICKENSEDSTIGTAKLLK